MCSQPILYKIGFRYAPKAVQFKYFDTLLTWILVCICSPAAFKNPYLIAKLIEVLFVLNPSIQPKTELLNNMMMSHPLSISHLPSALMKFYTGIWYMVYLIEGIISNNVFTLQIL